MECLGQRHQSAEEFGGREEETGVRESSPRGTDREAGALNTARLGVRVPLFPPP